jgi:hypothetical protein
MRKKTLFLFLSVVLLVLGIVMLFIASLVENTSLYVPFVVGGAFVMGAGVVSSIGLIITIFSN